MIFQAGTSNWGGTRKLPYAFTDYNDINEDTRIQLELINQALAGLQVKHREQEGRKRPRIGFVRTED